MGNELSHQKHCCRNSGKFETPATEQENAAADLPEGQPDLGGVLWSSVNPPPKEKSPGTATGMENKDAGREIASSLLPVAQVLVGTTELQDLGGAQPSAEQPEETENKHATAMSLDRETRAPAQEIPATAQQPAGDTGVATTDLPLQTATGTGAGGAEDLVTNLATTEGSSAVRKRLRDKLRKPSPLCRWLKNLKSPAEKAKAKPDAFTGQE